MSPLSPEEAAAWVTFAAAALPSFPDHHMQTGRAAAKADELLEELRARLKKDDAPKDLPPTHEGLALIPPPATEWPAEDAGEPLTPPEPVGPEGQPLSTEEWQKKVLAEGQSQ